MEGDYIYHPAHYMFLARCRAQQVPPFTKFLHLVATTDWNECRPTPSESCVEWGSTGRPTSSAVTTTGTCSRMRQAIVPGVNSAYFPRQQNTTDLPWARMTYCAGRHNWPHACSSSHLQCPCLEYTRTQDHTTTHLFVPQLANTGFTTPNAMLIRSTRWTALTQRLVSDPWSMVTKQLGTWISVTWPFTFGFSTLSSSRLSYGRPDSRRY
jgi:hypothetical protein